MPPADDAVSEIVSFILILGIIAVGIAIFAAISLPEIEKSKEIEQEKDLSQTFSQIKTGIDKLWIFGTPEIKSGTLLSLGTKTLTTAGTVHLKEGTKLTFNHTYGQKTACLLYLSVTPAYHHLKNTMLVLEGGGLFQENTPILPHTKSEAAAVLICRNGEEQILSANSPVTVLYTYQNRETFTNVSSLCISASENPGYWNQALSGTKNITLLTYQVQMEAAV